MAEAMAIELVKVVALKLADEAFKTYARSQGIHSEVTNLGRELSRIQAVLKDASDKEIKEEAVKQWLNDLQHLAYDIDDVLDDVATEAMHRELTQEAGPSTSKVRKFIPTCCTNFALSHRLSPKLDSLTFELRRLEKQKEGLGLIIKKDEKPRNTSRRNETSLPDVSSVVGREGEIEKLLNKLLREEPSKENFSIVPIVGMGGIGKTTLARLLFNNPQVKDHFTIKAWVCVSDDFDIFKISDTILQSVTKENKDFKDLNQIQMALIEQFKDKRFLLVVDDVWSENYTDWENLVRPFYSGAPGSRIIITTRKEQLLINLGFDHLDRLESLSHEDALSLFALHALGVGDFNSHKTFEPHGEGIVKKCGGLPLALKTIGRMMKTKTDEEDWEDVLKSEIWDLGNVDEIVPSLRISYHDLSADLKQLFAYCSLFPKDFLFDKEELVLLWMAEGFLGQSNMAKLPERLGHEYFEILLSRSFFQHAPNDESLFIMHDLMNDLATFVAGEYFLRLDNYMKIGKETLSKYRYMSFTREKYVSYHKFEALKRATSLRTFLPVYIRKDQSWDYFYLSNKILVDFLFELKLLRVLCLNHFQISEVPQFIGTLKHLRYLNLSRTNIKEVPENVSNLYNLQTLIVSHCRSLKKLPNSFLKLKKLWHFDIRDTPLLKKLPLGIGELESLQTLTKIIIGGNDGLLITALKRLKNLHGKISIEGLHTVQSIMHAREANLSSKKLVELELKWVDVFNGSRRCTVEKDVLNELKPHSNKLKRLSVKCYGGIEFPNWVGDPCFHNLVNLSLADCRNCISLPPLGQLPSLKKLFIRGMNKIKVIGLELMGTGFVAFPSLEIIRFQDMSSLEVWSTKNKGLNTMLPCLRELHIGNCPRLIDVSIMELPSLRVLQIDRCVDGVLRSLVRAASSITKLDIMSISGLSDEVWRGVIEYLGSVKQVTIYDCNEIRYLWESEAEVSNLLMNLEALHVYECKNLVSLGENEGKGDNFRSLKKLEIVKCDSMKRCCCPNSIENLRIFLCSSLIDVSFPITPGGGRGGQKLKSLEISYCKRITTKIDTISMPMLEEVYICEWMNMKSVSHMSNFIHLTMLLLGDCPNLETFPDLLLSNVTSLKHLGIVTCPSIDNSFPRGLWPPNLISLRIGGLSKPISEWGAQNFPSSLVQLTFCSENVTTFRQLSHLLPPSLTELCIEDFDQLESLSFGLQHLTSLQKLTLGNCPKLKYLPETLLPSLLSLEIHQCQDLKERCNGRGSYYWPLISHIPCVGFEVETFDFETLMFE